MTTSISLYHYRAVVQSVYDGDTITVDIDLGMKTKVIGEKIRLSRINAPELRGGEREDGLEARDYLRERILGREVYIQTFKDKRGKYGRYIGEILLEEEGSLININDELATKGYAQYQDY